MKPTSRSLIVPALMLLPVLVLAQGADQPALTINGHTLDDPAALLAEGHLLLADTVLASDLGVQVQQDKGLWRLSFYSHEWALRAGERTVLVDGQETTAAIAPLQRDERLYVPLALLAETLQLIMTHEDNAWQIASPTAVLQQLRQGGHADRVRFVLDLAAPVSYRVVQEPGRVVLELPAPAGAPQVLRLHDFDETLAPQVTESVLDGVLRIAISHESPDPPQFLTLGEPARLVVDLMREQPTCAPPDQPQPPVEIRPAPGDIWDVYQFAGSKGPTRGFVVRFNPAKTSWTLRPALAGATIMQRRTVSRIARDEGAYAAINGGFFASQGPPLGLLVIDGEWIKPPLYHRAVLGITKDGKYHIANVDLDARVEFTGLGMLPLERFNEGHLNPDTVVAFTPRWGPVVTGAPDKVRLAVNAAGVVSAVYGRNVNAPVPPGGYILSGNGHRADTLTSVPQGTAAKLVMQTSPRWPGLWQAVGGGPLLVQNGLVALNAKAERFRDDVALGCRPRTAVGLATNGDVILVAIERPGMTLGELARTMAKLGARLAMNLDGGGSTALVVNGRLLNRPDDGCERAVSNAILVTKR